MLLDHYAGISYICLLPIMYAQNYDGIISARECTFRTLKIVNSHQSRTLKCSCSERSTCYNCCILCHVYLVILLLAEKGLFERKIYIFNGSTKSYLRIKSRSRRRASSIRTFSVKVAPRHRKVSRLH